MTSSCRKLVLHFVNLSGVIEECIELIWARKKIYAGMNKKEIGQRTNLCEPHCC